MYICASAQLLAQKIAREQLLLPAGAACVLLQRGWLVGGLQFLTTAIKGEFFSFNINSGEK
jgi:hypothetical protein